MAQIYHRETINAEDKHVVIRAIDEEDYHVAITFALTENEEDCTEVLLTKDEVQYAYDLLFNR